MRKIDKKKSSAFERAAKTINFEKIVLERLEKIAKLQETSVTNIVNMLCRRYIMTDSGYYETMAKEYMMKFHEMKYMADQAKIMVETQ